MLHGVVGQDGDNYPDDVNAVQDLLCEICADESHSYSWGSGSVPSDEVISLTLDDIVKFQVAVGLRPTGYVDQRTLECMNHIAEPLGWEKTPPKELSTRGKWWWINEQDVNDGWIPRCRLPQGYYVRHDGNIPSDKAGTYQVLLYVNKPPLRISPGRPVRQEVMEKSIELPGSAESRQDARWGLLDKGKLEKLLEIFANFSLWNMKVEASLLVVKQRRGEKLLVTRSPSEHLLSPVEPYPFELTSQLGADNLGDKHRIHYTGAGDGRLLSQEKFGKYYYFVNQNQFEKDEKLRGFDCSTFVGTVFGIAPENSPGSANQSVYALPNESLAQAIGVSETHPITATTECNVDLDGETVGTVTCDAKKDAKMKKVAATIITDGAQCKIRLAESISGVSELTVDAKKISDKKPKTVKENAKKFFEANSKGIYIAHSSGHFILVKNGTVHEFNSPPGQIGSYGDVGYYHTAASAYSWWGGNWTIYKTNRQAL
jgi:hypothetical protein